MVSHPSLYPPIFPVLRSGVILFSIFHGPQVLADMGDPVPAKRYINIISDIAFKTSSPIVRKEFARTVSNGFWETMWRDMDLCGCKCDSGFNFDECVIKPAGMVRMHPQWHYRAVHCHCMLVAQKKHGMRLVN